MQVECLKKHAFALVLAIAVSGIIMLDAPAAMAAEKPNIVVIMGDDVGWSNLGAYGGDIPGVPTPNIDRLAKEGMRLTHDEQAENP